MSTTEWHPARLLQSSQKDQDFALIILNQPLDDHQTLNQLWQNSSYHIAADGGANRLYSSTQRVSPNPPPFSNLHAIIGDLDSLTPTTQSYYTSVFPSVQIIHDADQYSTDFTKAVRHIRSSRGGDGPVDIVAMGGLGGRVDQGLSQLHHLYMFQTTPAYEEGKMYLVSGESLTFLLKAGAHKIHVRESRSQFQGEANEEVFGKYAGVVPIKEPSVITLRGFEWDVTDWHTEFGGQISTSNHVLPETQVVEVTTSKDVLFTIALREKSK
ncbi:thiamine pyrophosphokinase [Xylariales sp. AK1849]|nr:thiamine pyrophosphokinase [Xylariales sp. AK1849]